MLTIQKKYNQKIIGQNLSSKEIELHTQQLALCAHAELSSLVNATNFKKHHGNLESVDRDNILFESIDVLRYIHAIQNLWNITGEEVEKAYLSKDAYLNSRRKIDNHKWPGNKVVIVDMDDVIVDFRKSFAAWLKKEYDIFVDVESEEYYFITALAKAGVNPELVFDKFINMDGFLELEVVPGAKEFISSLRAMGYWIQILTARPEENLRCMYNTYQWLHNHDSESIAFAIDDSPKHASEYSKHGINVKVPVKSYNKTITGENISFYNSFNDLIMQIKEK